MSQARALGAMLVVAVSYLGFAGFLSLMASMGLVPWGDASEAVQAFSVLSSLGIGGVIGLYLGGLDPEYSLRHGADLPEKIATTNPTWIIVYYHESVSAETDATLEANGFTERARFPGWVDWTNGDVVVHTD